MDAAVCTWRATGAWNRFEFRPSRRSVANGVVSRRIERRRSLILFSSFLFIFILLLFFPFWFPFFLRGKPTLGGRGPKKKTKQKEKREKDDKKNEFQQQQQQQQQKKSRKTTVKTK